MRPVPRAPGERALAGGGGETYHEGMTENLRAPGGRWVGVDHGRRRIGLALADPRGQIASPATVIDATDQADRDAQRVAAWAAEYRPAGFVVGLPLNMDGSEGPQAARVRRFAQALAAAGGLPVELWDERLSSFQADEHMAAGGLTREQRARRRDMLAAQVILQSFLDARRAAD